MKSIIIYATRYGCTEKAVKLLQRRIPDRAESVNIGEEKAPTDALFAGAFS